MKIKSLLPFTVKNLKIRKKRKLKLKLIRFMKNKFVLRFSK